MKNYEKRIISLVFAFVILLTLTVSAWAIGLGVQQFTGGVIPEGDYSMASILIFGNSTVTIEGPVKISRMELSTNSILKISGSGASLTGNGVEFMHPTEDTHPFCSKIVVESGGSLDITFKDSDSANKFEELLNKGGAEFTRTGNRISTEATCHHENAIRTIKTIKTIIEVTCPDCAETWEETVEGTNTASTLSQGNMTIVCTVAGVALGLVGGLLIGKRKKKITAEEE